MVLSNQKEKEEKNFNSYYILLYSNNFENCRLNVSTGKEKGKGKCMKNKSLCFNSLTFISRAEKNRINHLIIPGLQLYLLYKVNIWAVIHESRLNCLADFVTTWLCNLTRLTSYSYLCIFCFFQNRDNWVLCISFRKIQCNLCITGEFRNRFSFSVAVQSINYALLKRSIPVRYL